MMDSLTSYLVTDFSYIHPGRYSAGGGGLIEFFDQVLICDTPPRLALLRDCQGLDTETLEKEMTLAREVILTNRPDNRTLTSALVFIFIPPGTHQDRVREILNLKPFHRGNCLNPILVDSSTGEIFFHTLKVPIEALDMLLSLKKKLKSPEKPKETDQKTLHFIEMKTTARLEGFHQALFRSRPYVTWILIIINIVMFMLMEISGQSTDSMILITHGAKVGPLIWQGEYWRLITPLFLHIGFLHLFSNCIIIFFLGPMIEALIGRRRMILIYLASGMAGNLLSLIMSPFFSAGASTGVFGLLGTLMAYGIVYRKDIPRHFYRMIILYIFPFILYNLLLGRFYTSLDNFAHAGGLMGGALTALALGVKYPANLPRRPRWAWILASVAMWGILLRLGPIPYPEAYQTYYQVLGTNAALDGHKAEAISYLQQALELEPDSTAVANRLGKVLSNVGFIQFDRGNYSGAAVYLEQAVKYLEIDSDYFEAHGLVYYRLGKCLEHMGQYRESITAQRKALVFTPDRESYRRELARALVSFAGILLEEDNFEEALFLAGESKKYWREYPRASIIQGRAMYMTGNFPGAASSWIEAVRIDPRNGEAENLLRRWIFKSLWYPPPEDFIHTGHHPEAVSLNHQGERLLREDGDFRNALELFQLSIRTDEEYPAPYLNAVWIHLMLGQTAQASSFIQQVRQFYPGDPRTEFLSSYERYISGDIPSARQQLEELTRNYPLYPESFALLGRIYREEGRLKASEEKLKTAVDLYPSNVVYRVEYARTLQKSGKSQEFFQQANTGIVYGDSQGRGELEVLIRGMLKTNDRRDEL